MTRDEIIKLAREAGCGWAQNGTEPVLAGEAQIERFAALVAAAEWEERLAEWANWPHNRARHVALKEAK